MKRFHWIAIWAGLFAVAGRLIGPGYDADAQPSAFMGAVIGALIGAFGWRGAGMLAGILAGVNIGVDVGGDIGGFLGIAVGASCGWCLVARVIRADRVRVHPPAATLDGPSETNSLLLIGALLWALMGAPSHGQAQDAAIAARGPFSVFTDP